MQLVTCRYLKMMFLLIDNILEDAFFLGLGIGQRTVSLLPADEPRETVAVGSHKIVGGYFQVVDERSHSYCRMQSYEQMYMVWHAIDTIDHAIVVLAKTENVHVEIALMGLDNGRRALAGAQHNVIDEFGVCHIVLLLGDPFRVGA